MSLVKTARRPSLLLACSLFGLSCLFSSDQTRRLLSHDADNAFQRVREYREVDLKQLDIQETKRLLRDLKVLIPERSSKLLEFLEHKDMKRVQEPDVVLATRAYQQLSDLILRPWYLWEFKRLENLHCYVLLEVQTATRHPGFTSVRLTQLNEAGEVVSEQSFATGWRTYLQSVNLSTLERNEYPIIILGTLDTPGHHANISARQYYAKIGTRFDLIRLEDVQGEPLRNPYYVQHFRHGPVIKQSAKEWESDLNGTDRLKILRVLVWLGGRQRNPRDGENANKQAENLQEAVLVTEVRARKSVSARLKKLAESRDRWIRETALLALKPED